MKKSVLLPLLAALRRSDVLFTKLTALAKLRKQLSLYMPLPPPKNLQ